MADKVANYSIKTDSNAKSVGDEASDALQRLKATIESSQGAMKDLSASMRALRGSSDEVKGAKAKLQAQIESERGALSTANLALLKQGSSYTKLAEQTKRAEIEQRKFQAQQEKLQRVAEQKAIVAAKKAVEDATKKFEAANQPVYDLKTGLDALKGAAGGLAGPIGAIVAAIGVITGVAFAAGAAVLYLAASLAHWLIVSADVQRSAALEREAWLGSAQQAMALGHQIDALRATVPTTREELQKLALETNKTFAQSYASGQGIVDTFNIIAKASAAMGDQVGNQLGDLIKRAKDFGRVQIQPLDLRGTTIALKDVAAELAKTMKVSVAQAEAALRGGAVKVDDAAAALRAAVEKRFGPINAKKMLSLDSLKKQLTDTLGALTKDVNLEPLLEGLSTMVKLFDQSTVSGAALKNLIDQVSKQLGPAIQELAPIAQEVFVRLEIQLYRVGLAVIDVRDKWRAAFEGTLVGTLTARDAVTALNTALTLIGTAGVAQVHVLGDAFQRIGTVVNQVQRVLDALGLLSEKSKGSGIAVGTGIADGIKAGTPAATDAASSLGEAVSTAFKKKLGIKSPSLVFQKYGEQIDEGAARGIDKGAPGVQDAVERMAPSPSGSRAGATTAPASSPMHFHFYVDARGASAGVGDHLNSGEFMTSLLEAFQGALKTHGIPTHTAEVTT